MKTNSSTPSAGAMRAAELLGYAATSTEAQTNAAAIIDGEACSPVKAALENLLEQVYQMKGLFDDEDGTIAAAISDAEKALEGRS